MYIARFQSHIYNLEAGTLVSCNSWALCWAELFQKNGDVALVCKAYNVRVVMQWLAETVAAAVQDERYMATDSRMTLVAVTMCLDYSQQVAYLLLYVLLIKTYIYTFMHATHFCCHSLTHKGLNWVQNNDAVYRSLFVNFPAHLRVPESPCTARLHLARFVHGIEASGRFLIPAVMQYFIFLVWVFPEETLR